VIVFFIDAMRSHIGLPALNFARVLDKLAPSEQQAFLKAMDMLETGLRAPDTPQP